MITAIKSEFRKLLSVRSTYVIMFLSFALVTLMSFYVEGYLGQSGSSASILNEFAIKEILGNSVGIAALFFSIIAILQVGHEYKHNTIMYTLTASSRRSFVFISKALVLSISGIIFGLIAMGFAVLVYQLGLSLRDAVLPAQDIDILLQLARSVFYMFAYTMVGFLAAIIIRNLIGSIAFILIYPTTVEPIAGLLLKDNAAYLPISAIDQTLGLSLIPELLNPNKATVVSAIYILIVGTIAWFLFLKRDATKK